MKNKRFILVLFILLFLLNTFNFVNADEDSQFLLSNFDNVATGLHNGTSGYLEFDSDVDNIFTTSTSYDLSAPNSLRISASSSTNKEGVINLTSDFDYIGFINISFEYMWSTSASSGFYWNFTDYNDNDVIRMRFTDDDLAWYSIGTGWQNIDTTTAITRQYIWITHNGTNQFNIKLLDSSFVVQTNKDFAGSYAGTYTNFSKMEFNIWASAGENAFCYFDNFYISTTFDGQFCDVSGYESLCFNPHDEYNSVPDGNKYIEYQSEYEYSMNLKSVILPISNDQYNLVSSNPSDYSLTVNGYVEGFADYIINFGTYYGIQWCDLGDNDTGIIIDDEKLLLAFASFQYFHTAVDNYYWYGVGGYFGGLGLSEYHNVGYWFSNDQLDGYHSDNFKFAPCVYFESDINDIILDDDILQPYIDKFGNEFIQFYKYDIECQYGVGDYLKIIYNLSDDNITGSDYRNPYVYVVEKVDIENSTTRWWSQGFIIMYGSYQSDIITIPKQLNQQGTYIVKLYNSSDFGSSLDTLLYTSMPIVVCQGEGGGGGYFDGGTGEGWYGLPNFTPYLLGVFITLLVTMSPLIIAVYITRKTKHKELPKIPSLLYVGFFFMGLVVSVLFGFIPYWLPFVILFGMILYFTIGWIYGKKEVTGE